jgi:hypothetical protein
VIIPDINLLVYAHNDRASEHASAKIWWEQCLNGSTPVGLPWVSAMGFLRLMTHPRVLVEPMPVSGAIHQVRSWIDQPPVRLLQPGTRFPALYFGYLEALGTGGNLTTDAWLAALAVEHQATLHSNDGDFSRFPGLRWLNPLKTQC